MNITVEGGKTVRLKTKGKYCDRDIVVTAEGGTEDLNAVLTEQEELIAELKDVLAEKASGGGDPVIEPLEITENGTYTAPDGVDGYSPVTVNVPIPDGYIVPSGTKDITENGTHDVTAYASVNVNVPSEEPLLQEKTVTENGEVTPDDGYDGLSKVVVNVEASGSDTTVEDGIVNRSISGAYTNNRVTSVGQFAFRGCTKITSFSFPKATSVGSNAIYGCSKLTSVNMPLVKSIGENAFNACSILPSIVLPSLTTGGGYMFRYCYLLLTIDLPVIKNIVANMFCDCRRLTAVILRSETMCTLANTSAFSNCYHFHGTKNSTYNPNGDKDGYIYVPSALIEDYKVATNWSSFASQFRAIEDYPEICG